MFWKGFEKHLVESLSCSWETRSGPAWAPLGRWFKLRLSLQGVVRTGCGNRWCEARTLLPRGSRGHRALPSCVRVCRIWLCPNSWAPCAWHYVCPRLEGWVLSGLCWGFPRGRDQGPAVSVLGAGHARGCSGVTGFPSVEGNLGPNGAVPVQPVLLGLGLLVTGTALTWSRVLGPGGSVG